MASKQISIQKEYEKNPDITPEDIKILRDWLATQPHLPGDYITDVDLLVAYHCCDKSLEITKQVIDLHFASKTMLSTYFNNRSLDTKVRNVFDIVLFHPMPMNTVDGYRTIYLRLIDTDPKKFNLFEIARTFMYVLDLLQCEEGTWPGFVVIIDMTEATLGHVARIDIMVLKTIIVFVQECLFVKFKEICFLNAPGFVDKVLMMMKPFMKKSLLDIIEVYPIGSDKFYKKIPKKAFPIESGGEYKNCRTINDEMWKWLKNNEDYFKNENKRRVNEKLRPGKPSAATSMFGIEGSFKKLDID